jgi:hypothetical protein
MAIDKSGEWNQEFDDVRAWLRKKVKEKGLKHSEIDKAIGNENSHMASHFLGECQPMLPTWEQWIIIKNLLGVDEDIDRPPKCVGYERVIIGYRRVHPGVAFTSIGPTELPITQPASDSAKQWEGWGTALKPAHEPICLARKPLSEKTVAENVLKWGTGGINVDGCRVEAVNRPYRITDAKITENNTYEGRINNDLRFMGGSKAVGTTNQGRWPANLIHDGSDEVVGLFPVTKTGDFSQRGQSSNTEQPSGWKTSKRELAEYKGDSGSAARFFYCAKASRSERDAGCEGMESNTHTFLSGGLPDPRMNHEQNRNPIKNNHPTVKPIKLMQYLCKLITPPGGTVLDPFCGSGSTIVACKNLNFNAIGIDLSEDYLKIAKMRIENNESNELENNVSKTSKIGETCLEHFASEE